MQSHTPAQSDELEALGALVASSNDDGNDALVLWASWAVTRGLSRQRAVAEERLGRATQRWRSERRGHC
eukprot:13880915-Alexandrium_andersonii.AAC.1